MKKKFLGICIMLMLVILVFSNVQAATGLLNVATYEDVFELSKQGEEITLPFLNVFAKAATYDKSVKHSGLSVGSSTIDINEKLSGVQTIFAKDTVTIKGELEHAIIFANNVVIEGKVTGDILIIAPSLFVTNTAQISGDLLVMGDSLDLKGKVDGNVISACGKNLISGTIAKDFRVVSDNITFENESIAGKVYVKTSKGVDTSKIVEKYPEATINVIEKQEDVKDVDISKVILNGIVTVVIYTAICYLITKKDSNIVTRMTTKFKENSTFGIISGVLMYVLVLILPIALILLGVFGLGIIAWPVLIAYIGIILFSLSISTFITGAAIYDVTKDKFGKFGWIAMAVIFIVLYAITNIPYIASYATIAINLISTSIIITFILKRKNKKVVEEDNKKEE